MAGAGLQRRLRQHLRGKAQNFFVVCDPGWESVCASEMNQLGVTSQQIQPGGVEYIASMENTWRLLAKARTPSRILMRLGSFRGENWGRMEHCLAGIPWELYLLPDSPLHFQVNSTASRLRHTEGIANRAQQVINERLQTHLDQNEKSKLNLPLQRQNIHIRVINDQFLISLDAAGDSLHLRGQNRRSGLAPLRDNTAAAILLHAGLQNCNHLIDPMCGSGTFSLEAALLCSNRFPGEFRDFACMQWPSFRPQTWVKVLHDLKNHGNSFPLQIQTSDIDNRAISRTVSNALLCGVEDLVQPQHQDFFNLIPQILDNRSLLVLNPPHGLRLSTPGGAQIFYRRLCDRLLQCWQGFSIALVAPESVESQLQSFPWDNKINLALGGKRLWVYFRLATRQTKD